MLFEHIQYDFEGEKAQYSLCCTTVECHGECYSVGPSDELLAVPMQRAFRAISDCPADVFDTGHLLSTHWESEATVEQLVNLFDLADVEKHRKQLGKRYSEFLRVAAMSAGIYVLPAGGIDPQSPHKQDEMYYVVRGRARLRAGTEDQAVREGGIIFVAAGVEHGFYEITEELMVLVFFAPAESE